MKTTSNGRPPENIKCGISQQPLIGSYSNFKLRLRRPKQSVQILQCRQPHRKDNLKILTTTVWIVTYEFLLEENSEEISSVALLSPACFMLKSN